MQYSNIIKLQERKKELNLTYEQIAEKSGLPLSTVQKVLGGKIDSPRKSTIDALKNALSVSFSLKDIRSEISIGNQDFAAIIENNYFYVDKTEFIKSWWESGDVVTLITRPRRFGKTLNLSMMDHFFSNKYQNGVSLFKRLAIWKHQEYRALVNQYPVIFLSFASVKGTSFETARQQIIQQIVGLYRNYNYVLDASFITQMDRTFWDMVGFEMSDATATDAIRFLCEMLSKYYEKKVLIFLDEYDTPIQEAYVDGFWNEMTGFVRNLFNATFKTNQYLERAILTGITRISKESIFSDLNNLKVDTITNARYESDFGFTEKEVRKALIKYDMETSFSDVKKWYDGFRIGSKADIYNPWSVTQFLDTGKLDDYWANTSENSLVDKLIKESGVNVKTAVESLLKGEAVEALIDDEIVFNLIDKNESGIFSLLLAAGYLKVVDVLQEQGVRKKYSVSLTNLEVKHTFDDMIKRWFEGDNVGYNDFIKALLQNDVKYMNRFMNDIALNTFSIFDVGKSASKKHEPERFYHGFVLGLMVDLSDKYLITSNRESGFGRYDVCLEPKKKSDPAYVIEFKVRDSEDEKDLQETVKKALKQIEDKKYDANLISKGVNKDRIFHYGFAFEGKKVLIG
ncbi:AAA family ATPase [Butyrivibrio fibrisolvens]|uniref:AAA family ATPase n=1 Tax=Butyrivibrio fibrisolvens TaxID=831 RepID=UPI000401E586|nr:AAA family ATPase [Butyrivibrio fibrisolvens]